MTRRSAGRFLQLSGGIGVLLGNFLPELGVLARNLLCSGPPQPMPDRSHWFVLREALDMLLDPDFSLQAAYYVYYGAQVLALVYLAAIGVSLAVSALCERSRLLPIALYAFHAAFLFALAVSGFYLSIAGPGRAEDSKGLYRAILVLAIALLSALALETTLALRVFRGRAPGRLLRADALSVLPVALLFLLSAGLFLRLRGSANWPAGVYLAIAAGAFLALIGIVLRREPAPPAAPASAP